MNTTGDDWQRAELAGAAKPTEAWAAGQKIEELHRQVTGAYAEVRKTEKGTLLVGRA